MLRALGFPKGTGRFLRDLPWFSIKVIRALYVASPAIAKESLAHPPTRRGEAADVYAVCPMRHDADVDVNTNNNDHRIASMGH